MINTEVLVSQRTMRLLDDPQRNRARIVERTIAAIAANPAHWTPLAAKPWYGARSREDMSAEDKQALGKHVSVVTWIEAQNAGRLGALCWALMELYELPYGDPVREQGDKLITALIERAWPGISIGEIPERRLLQRWCRRVTRLYAACSIELRDIGGAEGAGDKAKAREALPTRVSGSMTSMEAL